MVLQVKSSTLGGAGAGCREGGSGKMMEEETRIKIDWIKYKKGSIY